MANRGEIDGAQGFQQGQAPYRDEQAHQAAENSEQQTFRQQLFDDLSARGAKRGSDSELMSPSCAASEEEVGHVRTSDEKDERDCARQEDQGRTNFPR